MADKNICIFGDSIVWGACDEKGGGWANRLVKYVNKKTDYEITVYNVGISGNNSEKLARRIKNEFAAREGTDAIVAIGINDSQYSKDKVNRISPIDYRKNLIRIYKYLSNICKSLVFISITGVDESRTRPIEYDKGKNYDNKNIKKYNKILKKFCNDNKILFIDASCLLGASDFNDGLHPNSRGHEKIYRLVKEKLENHNILTL